MDLQKVYDYFININRLKSWKKERRLLKKAYTAPNQ